MLDASAAAPRPLHLASGSVIGSPGWDSPPNEPANSAPSSAQTTNAFSETSHPPHRLNDQVKRQSASHSRQKSSISYIRSESTPPSISLLRRDVIKSPLRPTPSAAENQLSFSELGLSMNNRTTVRNSMGSIRGDRSSIRSFADDPKIAEFARKIKERPPITLAEK